MTHPAFSQEDLENIIINMNAFQGFLWLALVAAVGTACYFIGKCNAKE